MFIFGIATSVNGRKSIGTIIKILNEILIWCVCNNYSNNLNTIFAFFISFLLYIPKHSVNNTTTTTLNHYYYYYNFLCVGKPLYIYYTYLYLCKYLHFVIMFYPHLLSFFFSFFLFFFFWHCLKLVERATLLTLYRTTNKYTLVESNGIKYHQEAEEDR